MCASTHNLFSDGDCVCSLIRSTDYHHPPDITIHQAAGYIKIRTLGPVLQSPNYLDNAHTQN